MTNQIQTIQPQPISAAMMSSGGTSDQWQTIREASAKGSGVNLFTASEQWFTRPNDQRFETLAQLRESVHERRLRSRAIDVDVTSVHARQYEGTGIILNSGLNPSLPSHWAFGQLASTIKAPPSYLRTLPADMAVPLVNYGLQKAARDAVKFMTVAPIDDSDSTPATLQAVTSPTYGRIWDADVVDAVQRVVDRTEGKFYNPKDWSGKGSGLYASDHDVFCFMIDGGSILDAGPRAQLNRGFIVGNSETGARSFWIMTFLFNIVCGNHIIWGAEQVNKIVIRHTSGGPGRFDSQAAPALIAFANASERPVVEAVKRAQEFPLLPQAGEKLTVEKVLEFCERNQKVAKFTRSEVARAVDFAKSEEGDCRTLWQLVQGFTAYARGFEFIDSRADLEKRAGKLMSLVAATGQGAN